MRDFKYSSAAITRVRSCSESAWFEAKKHQDLKSAAFRLQVGMALTWGPKKPYLGGGDEVKRAQTSSRKLPDFKSNPPKLAPNPETFSSILESSEALNEIKRGVHLGWMSSGFLHGGKVLLESLRGHGVDELVGLELGFGKHCQHGRNVRVLWLQLRHGNAAPFLRGSSVKPSCLPKFVFENTPQTTI